MFVLLAEEAFETLSLCERYILILLGFVYMATNTTCYLSYSYIMQYTKTGNFAFLSYLSYISVISMLVDGYGG